MLSFTASADLGYHGFIASNEKFVVVFVRGFMKSDAPGARRLEKCHVRCPNRFCLTLYDVINYNHVTSASSSYK